MSLCLLELIILFFTDVRAYIIHISLFVFAFIPVLNWIAALVILFMLCLCIINGDIKLKVNKVTKFLFNIDED